MLRAIIKQRGQRLFYTQLMPKARVITTRFFGLKDEAQSGGTMKEVKEKIMNHLGLDFEYKLIPKNRENLLKYTPKLEDLPGRSMKDSFTSAIIPLSTNIPLRDSYVSVLGNVRMGRLLEDTDMFAVWVLHKHLEVPQLPENVFLPYTFVTVLVDKVSFAPLRPTADQDIRLSGHVSFVGRSSAEVVVWLEQFQNNRFVKITRALFLMAARNATNTSSAPLNPIVPANEEEKKILAGGQERNRVRRQIQEQSIFKVEPNDHEQTLMYKLYQRTTNTQTMQLNERVLPPGGHWMSESSATSIIASFPENRNAHNTVFGGFLMRQAVENSWICAYKYSRQRPRIAHMCDVSFHKPVKVSSIIKMTSYVVYTEANYMQIMTVADILDTLNRTESTSNVFYFTYTTMDIVPEILPHSYHETMWYIQGRRKFKYSLGLE